MNRWVNGRAGGRSCGRVGGRAVRTGEMACYGRADRRIAILHFYLTTRGTCEFLTPPAPPSGDSHGTCALGGVCLCAPHWVGERCELACVNGTNDGGGTCACDAPCMHGVGCHIECSTHGRCGPRGDCICNYYDGFTGAVCGDESCPGWPAACEGRGECMPTGQCACYPGFHGRACELLDCPGDPDCSGVSADCTVAPGETSPRCVNCSYPYMGDACELR